MMTLQEIAKELKLSIFQLRRWCKSGYLPAYKIGEGKQAVWRVKESDYKEWQKKWTKGGK